MFWLNWASYYYGRPDGLTYQKQMTRKTTDSRHLMVSWCLPSWLRFIRKTLYPWRIWSTPSRWKSISQDAAKDLKLSEWKISANFMALKTLSYNGFSNTLKHVANSKEKQLSCRWCSVIGQKSSSPPRNNTYIIWVLNMLLKAVIEKANQQP